MTNISSLLTRTAPTPARLAHAHTWSAKGLELAAHARNELARARTADPACERVWAVLLFNLGAVLEVRPPRPRRAAAADCARDRCSATTKPQERTLCVRARMRTLSAWRRAWPRRTGRWRGCGRTGGVPRCPGAAELPAEIASQGVMA